jgi:hypothetical protein
MTKTANRCDLAVMPAFAGAATSTIYSSRRAVAGSMHPAARLSVQRRQRHDCASERYGGECGAIEWCHAKEEAPHAGGCRQCGQQTDSSARSREQDSIAQDQPDDAGSRGGR